ncbi:MAG: 3-mercaptopyruvate sulfurtransferase [Aestuariivirga sp.]|uniref:3-mercaptopyruvate sulfurtransferase n=1 Tax=Aestuariivirga sp. TaxID=2650926 RepID=UPI0025C6BCA2|nr:3-mercaptopyruvate sulfurtransferase [Aestuariivirga sp.]MCA3559995.1 3-mercaptopyruvate sulfurtransferase [Aestuariivirga sp.]
MSNDIVSTQWLEDHLGSPDIAIIDASWHLPTANRDARKEFRDAHIPGAQFFDIDELSDTTSSLPHMLPSPEKFSSRMRKMGIGDGKRVIAYDSVGLFSAARAWWMFKVFGHDDVAILDGGLKKWLAEERATEDGPALPCQERHFTARFKGSMVKDMRDVAAALKSGTAQVADARSATRFRGEEVEPRAHVRAGHMPGAKNVHYASLLNPDGTLKSREDIAATFKAAGIDLARPVITSCGSGITAAILSLGLTLTGAREHALYDGSWTEWGGDPDAAAATGA